MLCSCNSRFYCDCNTSSMLMTHQPCPSLASVGELCFEELEKVVAAAAEGNTSIRPEVLEEHLASLAHIYGSKHLSKALEIVDKPGAVVCHQGEKSGRKVYQVHSTSADAQQLYLVFPKHYCTCHAFHFDVTNKGEALCCKHQLAVRITEVLRRYSIQLVPDFYVAELLARGFTAGRCNNKQYNRYRTLIHCAQMASEVLHACENVMIQPSPNKKLKVQAAEPSLLVKRLSEFATLPQRASTGAAGYDLSSAYDYVIPARGKEMVKTDIAIKLPSGTYGRVAPRSGLAWKHSIDVGAGVIDEDYRGNVGVILFNHSDTPFEVKRGDRVAQLILERISTPAVEQVEDLDDTHRGAGGFGSTGVAAST